MPAAAVSCAYIYKWRHFSVAGRHTLDRFARPQMSVLAGPEDQNTTRTQQQYRIRLFCGDLDINLIPRRPLMPSDGRQASADSFLSFFAHDRMMRSMLDFPLHISLFDAIRGADSVDVMDECVIFPSY